MYWFVDNRPPHEISNGLRQSFRRGWRGEENRTAFMLLLYTLQNMTLTKFLTSPKPITIQYDTQYRPLSDASVTISCVGLHMHKLQT